MRANIFDSVINKIFLSIIFFISTRLVGSFGKFLYKHYYYLAQERYELYKTLSNFLNTCLREMFEVHYLRGKIISIQQLPLCLPLFFLFSFEVLKSGIKSYFDGVVFQDEDAVMMLYLFVVFLLHREFSYVLLL